MAADSIITKVAMLIASTIISTRRCRASKARISTVPLQQESAIGQLSNVLRNRPVVAMQPTVERGQHQQREQGRGYDAADHHRRQRPRSEEHTSELQTLMPISYAV